MKIANGLPAFLCVVGLFACTVGGSDASFWEKGAQRPKAIDDTGGAGAAPPTGAGAGASDVVTTGPSGSTAASTATSTSTSTSTSNSSSASTGASTSASTSAAS